MGHSKRSPRHDGFPSSSLAAFRGVIPALLVASSACSFASSDSQSANPGAEVTQAETLDEAYEKYVPAEIKKVVSLGKDIVKAYTTVGIAVDVVTTFLQQMDVISAPEDPLTVGLRELHLHLDRSFSAIDWSQTQRFSQDRLGTMLSAVQGAHQSVLAGIPLQPNSGPDNDSRTAVYQAEQPIAFMRYFDESSTDGEHWPNPWAQAGDFTFFEIYGSDQWWFVQYYLQGLNWKRIIPDRPAIEGGNVYDWRVGIAELTLLISLRLQVIAAIDPDFKNSGVYDAELTDHRNALARERDKMVSGVVCSSVQSPGVINYIPYQTVFVVACADIHTGDSEVAYLRFVDFEANEPEYRAEVDAAMWTMWAHIADRLPLAQLDEMIASLDELRAPAPPPFFRPRPGDRLPRFPGL